MLVQSLDEIKLESRVRFIKADSAQISGLGTIIGVEEVNASGDRCATRLNRLHIALFTDKPSLSQNNCQSSACLYDTKLGRCCRSKEQIYEAYSQNKLVWISAEEIIAFEKAMAPRKPSRLRRLISGIILAE